MPEYIDSWKFIAGLGIFLFGMDQLENSIESLAGRSFKLFLKRNTESTFKAILSGLFVTAILQSSSVVMLITLAFVGAGIIKMKNALGIIFGANLGTTFTGWVVVFIGFKLNVETFALPLAGIGGLLLILFKRWERLKLVGQFLVGFGFLFLGLDFMKISVEYLAQHFDLSAFSSYRPWVFLLIGFGFTAIIQSSSASMVITLSALYSGVIPFSSAAAMIIGADLGTTITALIGGLPGVPAKKRVALGHFLFNLVTDVIAFALLGWLTFFIRDVAGAKDELVALVLFHSTFNLLGIFIFVPFVGYFSKFLENRFRKTDHKEGKFIHNVTFEIQEAAIEALNNETNRLMLKVFNLIRSSFVKSKSEKEWGDFLKTVNTFKIQYHQIKRLEGEMFVFYNTLQKEPLQDDESSRLNQLILSIRYALHAAKGFKDIEPNLSEFKNSTKDSLNTLYEFFCEQNTMLFDKIEDVMQVKQQTDFEDFQELMMVINTSYDRLLAMMNTERKYHTHLDDIELSTVLTVNRELYSAYKALIMAMANLYLSPDKAHEFSSLRSYT